MSSLFNNRCGCGHVGKSTSQSKHNRCKGCVCEILAKQANRSILDFCQTQVNRYLITLKGANGPLNVDPGIAPTEFELISFDPKTCCAVFRFTGPDASGTRTIVLDCKSIASLVCAPPSPPVNG